MTLSQLFHKLNTPHTEVDIKQLVTNKATSILFPDLKEHRTRIQSLDKYEMSVVSTGDLESLELAVNGLGIPADRAISAEGARYYKAPHRYLPACHEGARAAKGAGAPRCHPRVGYPRGRGSRHGRGLH